MKNFPQVRFIFLPGQGMGHEGPIRRIWYKIDEKKSKKGESL
jgi:hypothetical protein